MGEIISRDARPRGRPAGEVLPQGERYALVIGVDNYQEPLKPLHNAVKDAEAVAEKLSEDFGFQVICLHDETADKATILEKLNRWKEETELHDSLIFFFAGHGDNLPDEEHGLKGYLLPINSSEDPDTWISESEVVQAAREMPASYVLLIFDACYAGTTFRDDIPPGARDDQVLKALVAGTEDQPVLDGGAGEHSIFTRSVLDGLEGFADSGQQPDDVITADELITYVRSEVRWRSRVRGHPQAAVGGSLQGTCIGEDFQFVPVKPRLKAPILRNLYSPEFRNRIAAAELLGKRTEETLEVKSMKVAELQRLLSQDSNRDVRVMAAKSLGTLGHPDGIPVLREELEIGRDREVQGSAAVALGVLTRSILDSGEAAPSGPETDRALDSLVKALKHDDPRLRQAAKEGLGYLPEATDRINLILEAPSREQHAEALDAMAHVGDCYPDSDAAWPPLYRLNHRLLRRMYLARIRMRRLWPGILRPVLGVGLGGAIGLSMAYFLMVLVAFESIQLYGPATLTFSVLPGAFAGAGLALMPRLVRGVYRKPAKPANIVAAILGGFFLSIGMILPNWFLGIGEDFFAWLLPGLLVGPSIGFALLLLPLEPSEDDRTMEVKKPWKRFLSKLQQNAIRILAIALVGFVSFAVARIPDATSIGTMEPQQYEVLFWGFGGAVLGVALAVSWLAWPLSTSGDYLKGGR